MKTFEELLAENAGLTEQIKQSGEAVAKLDSAIAAVLGLVEEAQQANTKLINRVGALEDSFKAHAETVAATGARIATLEEAKVDLDRHVVAELAKRGVSQRPAADRSAKPPGVDSMSQYAAATDPMAAGRIWKENKESILETLRAR